MNKCHYYLSNGLWEVVKVYFDVHSKLENVYFWAMAVAPHHTCFFSHLVASPWQQSWTTLQLLQHCLQKAALETSLNIFSASDINSVKKEVDFQFTLRNSATDPFVQGLFETYGKHGTIEFDNESSLQELLSNHLQVCSSTAHCFARQIKIPPRLLDSSTSSELSLLIIATMADTPSLPRVISLAEGTCRSELLTLLLANGETSILRRIEEERQQKIFENTLLDLQQLVHQGIEPKSLFQSMVLTDRHFVIHLLDCMELSPTITQTEKIPKFLWPLLLLKLWGKSDITEFQIQTLIDQCKESTGDQIVLRVCFMLEWYLSFSRWSANQAGGNCVGLEAAREHSVLRLIHTSADLAEADWDQVRALLHEPWDLQLLDAFCAHILLLRAMTAAATVRRDRIRFVDAEETEKKLAAEYSVEVTERLEQIRNLLRGLYPLRFRLEVMENLFGLIFITWDDLHRASLRRRSVADPQSSGAAPARSTSATRGFLCGPHIVRDIISLLKDCTAELESEPKTEPEVEFPCSIKTSQMENRLDRLTDALTEATWRLQLVTGPDFKTDMILSTSERDLFEPEWLVDSWQEQGKTKRRSAHEKREESGSQSPASGGETDRNADAPPGPGFMHQMLSSDWSLVVRCLSQGDFLNADHIIKMMSTEENQQLLEGELNFTQEVMDIRRRLVNQAESPTRKPPLPLPGKSGTSEMGIQLIQQVTAQGLSSNALTHQLELLLSSSKLPAIQGSSLVTLGSMQNSAATVALDLAITATTSYMDFRDILNLAGKHCPELTNRLQPPLNNSECTKPLGNIAISQILMTLLHEINRETPMSVGKFLRNRQASFSLRILKDQENLWKNLKILTEEFSTSRRDSETLGKDLGSGKKKVMKKILEELSKVTFHSTEILELGRNETNDSRHISYSELVNRYLSDLAAFSMEGVSPKPDGNNPVTFHALLGMSAVQIVDRLVFGHHVDPAILEKRAQQLGFNLCASLIWGCCPSIPQGPLPISMSTVVSNSNRIILNTYFGLEVQTSKDDIVTIASSIFSDLRTALKEFASTCETSCTDRINMKDLIAAGNEDAILAILKRTEAFIGLEWPGIRNDLFSFYVTLCNLMSLHGLLDSKLRDDLSSSKKLIRDSTMCFIAYQIGNEVVCLSELKNILCGQNIHYAFTPHTSVQVTDSFVPDPRCVFLLPVLEMSSLNAVMPAENVERDQVSSCVATFVQQYLILERNRLKIPPFLEWYLDSVLIGQLKMGLDVDPNRRRNVLFEFLMENCNDDGWRSKLKDWSHKGLYLETLPTTFEPSVRFSYCDHIEVPYQSPSIKTAYANHWETRTLTEPIIKQIGQSSRLLADLVARLHDARAENAGKGVEMAHDILLEDRLRCLEALLAAPWIQQLAPLFRGNVVLAALHKVPPTEILWTYLDHCANENRWIDCWNTIKALPDFYVKQNVHLRRVRDLTLFELTAMYSLSGTDPGWMYSQNIWDDHLRLESCFKYHEYWPGSIAVRQFSMILRDNPNMCEKSVLNIQSAIKNITIHNSIAERCQQFECKTWSEVAALSLFDPENVLKNLMDANQLQLCLEWLRLPRVAQNFSVRHIDTEMAVRFATQLPRQWSALIGYLPATEALKLSKDILPQLTSFQALRSIAERCCEIATEEEDINMFKKLRLGINLLSLLEEELTPQLARIASEPLLIIEQLLMNTRLDSIRLLLKKLRQLPDNDLMPEKIVNDLLTTYASRALEVNVIKVVPTVPRENFLVTTNTDFVIPTEVPDKNQWVPDEQVKTCMSCRLVNFSMFNRRHHCRRCGRVICTTCSRHRLKVQGYEGVPVRVCKDCYTHHLKPEGDRTSDRMDSVSSSDVAIQYWFLTTDESRNVMLREDFAYENAPNSSLCLAIFNLLPNSPVYTSLLLDESEKLLQLLQARDTAGNPEVDYVVLIQIVRSLIIGAKVRYGQAGLATGIGNCDRLLSHVDVISLFVKNHCMRLIPTEPFGENTMRALRDRLVEEELWDLAIEFSTKAGLPIAGVFATWGKVLLAAGSWHEARQKFSQCLSPSTSHSRNAPLLEEICRIIEATTFTETTMNNASSSSSFEVLETLATLKGLTTGKTPLNTVASAGSPQFLEQEWYLTKYGNMAALLRFYFRHEQWITALSLLIQRQIDPELFIDCLLLPAYRLQAHERLINEMTSIDSSLEAFKNYLVAACVHLEKNNLLRYLHHLQIFMQDYIRGAMSCIQLYQSQGSRFGQLVKRSELLQTAIRHLEAEMAVLNKKTRRLDYVMSLDYKELNRHMNTMWRQLETAKFLGAAETALSNTDITMSTILSHLAWEKSLVPTLFDSDQSRNTLAALCILAGKNVDEGFGLSFRIIQDFNLPLPEVLTQVGKVLASLKGGSAVMQLVECIKYSGIGDVPAICDQVLAAAVPVVKDSASILVTSIQNTDLKIDALIATKELKRAYLLALKPKRTQKIQKILEEAEKCGQLQIASICRRNLGLNSDSECSSLANSDILET